jgi:O-antigen ligase
LAIVNWINRIRNGSALAVFFLAPLWWRPGWTIGSIPYFFGFLIAIPWALTIIGWALTGFGDGKTWRAARLWLIPWLLLIGWAFVTQWWALFPNPAADASLQLVAVALFAVAMTTAAPPAYTIAIALAAGALLQSLIAVGQVLVQAPLGLSLFGEFTLPADRSGLSTLTVNGIKWLRPYGLTAHPNILGGCLAVALLAIGTALIVKTAHGRWLWIGLLTAAIIWWGLLLSFSRSAWLAVAIGGGVLLFLLAWRCRDQIAWRRTFGLVLGAGLIAGVFLVTYRDLVFARTGFGDETGEQRSVVDRSLFIEFSLQMIQQKPVLGWGIGMNDWESAQLIQQSPRKLDLQALPVHNIPLLVWSELGLIGFILWLAALIGAGWFFARRSIQPIPPLAIGLAGAAVALLVVGQFDFYPWRLFQDALLWWGVLGAAIHEVINAQPLSRLGNDHDLTL